jgi:hypothetical protein
MCDRNSDLGSITVPSALNPSIRRSIGEQTPRSGPCVWRSSTAKPKCNLRGWLQELFSLQAAQEKFFLDNPLS